MALHLIKQLSPPEHDRLLQAFLAQARGKRRNGDLLRQAIDRAVRIQAARSPDNGVQIMDDALIETLKEVTGVLDSLRAPYAITGSVASSVHGEPYSSLDVDLVLQASPRQATELAKRLTPRFYAPQDMVSDAARDHGMTNVMDNRTGLKVDLSFVRESGFFGTVMQRRVKSKIGTDSPEFDFVTPEDIILMKLVWRKDTRSQKQWENALSVAQVRGARMDWKYLFDQAKDLEIEDDLIKLRDEAGI